MGMHEFDIRKRVQQKTGNVYCTVYICSLYYYNVFIEFTLVICPLRIAICLLCVVQLLGTFGHMFIVCYRVWPSPKMPYFDPLKTICLLYNLLLHEIV